MKTPKLLRLLLMLCLTLIVTMPSKDNGDSPSLGKGTKEMIVTAQANEHYVSPDGTGTWEECTSTNTPCSLETANANASAGDVVVLRGGTYPFSQLNGRHLKPENSGTSDDWIVFKNYRGETPELKGTYGTRMWGLNMSEVSYIQVDGLIFTDYTDYSIGANSHHIEIKNCTFRNETPPYRRGIFIMWEICVGGMANNCPVHDIWVHHNTFYKLSAGGGCNNGSISEGGDAVRIGLPSNVSPPPSGDNSHITIENNYMAYAGHAVMDSYGQNCVFKNNVAHNEPWYPADNGDCEATFQPSYENPAYNGLYSHRVWAMTDTFQRDGVFNLVEGNRVGYGGVNPNNNGAESMNIGSSRNILRYNAFYGSMNYGIMPKYGPTGWQSIGGLNNAIYNNTIYKHGYGYPFFQTCTNDQLSTCPQPMYGINFYYPDRNTGNSIKNNIVYGNYQAVGRGTSDIRPSEGNTIENNWLTADGDPLFENPDLSQTTSQTLPDLHLKSGSEAINKGGHLTTVTAVTDPTHITLADPLMFQDGTWGADMTHGITLFPDWIAIGNVNNIAQISSIDYQTGVVTLTTAPTSAVQEQDKVWLHKNSAGIIVLHGSAPDVGAYEFTADLELHGTPANQAIHLDWTLDITPPFTGTWHIEYYTTTAQTYTTDIPSSAARSTTLTDHVRNNQMYTITINAMLDNTVWLSDTVQVMPTDKSIYLPLIQQ